MSAHPQRASRSLPESPDLRHLKDQAKDLLDAGGATLAEVRASGDDFAFLSPAVETDDDKVCFCYVDTRKRIGHYTEYLWVDEAIKPLAAMPDLDS